MEAVGVLVHVYEALGHVFAENLGEGCMGVWEVHRRAEEGVPEGRGGVARPVGAPEMGGEAIL